MASKWFILTIIALTFVSFTETRDLDYMSRNFDTQSNHISKKSSAEPNDIFVFANHVGKNSVSNDDQNQEVKDDSNQAIPFDYAEFSQFPDHIVTSLISTTSVGVTGGLSLTPLTLFHEFIQLFNKTYHSEAEKFHRFKVFVENAFLIAEHNLKFLKKLYTYKLDFNTYADWTHEEFVKTHNGLKPNLARHAKNPKTQYGDRLTYDGKPLILSPPIDEYNKTVNWVEMGAVTPIKNQGNCGSCWAFSATGALEGQNYVKNGQLVSLSEQNLVDCSFSYGNEGCNGGLMDNAFEYIKMNKGIDTEAGYPYTGREGQKCKFNRRKIGALDYGFVDLPVGNERALMEALAIMGPVAIGIDASHVSFQFYRSGIYQNIECSNTSLDHGVLAVGYGDDLDDSYWLIKNSWGTGWGEKGFVKILRNKNNMCGVATAASLPIEKKNVEWDAEAKFGRLL